MSGPPEALPSIALLYTTFKIVLYYTYFLFDSRDASTTMVQLVFLLCNQFIMSWFTENFGLRVLKPRRI